MASELWPRPQIAAGGGFTPQAMYLSLLRGSGSHDNLSSGLDTTNGLIECILYPEGRVGGRVGAILTPEETLPLTAQRIRLWDDGGEAWHSIVRAGFSH